MPTVSWLTIIALIGLVPIPASQALAELYLSDQAETRLIRRIQQQLDSGKLETLGNKPHYALVQSPIDNNAQSKGGVIIVHELGEHADWRTLIHPLRSRLPEYGWNTVSIQLPVVERMPTAAELPQLLPHYVTRLQAAIAYLKQKQVNNIIVLAHGFSSRVVARAINNDAIKSQVKALVAVDSRPLAGKQLELLSALELPLLHIQPPGVKAPAATVKTLALNKAYRRLDISLGNYGDHNSMQLLLKRTRSWLRRYAAGVEQAPAP